MPAEDRGYLGRLQSILTPAQKITHAAASSVSPNDVYASWEDIQAFADSGGPSGVRVGELIDLRNPSAGHAPNAIAFGMLLEGDGDNTDTDAVDAVYHITSCRFDGSDMFFVQLEQFTQWRATHSSAIQLPQSIAKTLGNWRVANSMVLDVEAGFMGGLTGINGAMVPGTSGDMKLQAFRSIGQTVGFLRSCTVGTSAKAASGLIPIHQLWRQG